ncbi:MAG: DUF2218 domain-containing protein [Chloroflexota bacterium]
MTKEQLQPEAFTKAMDYLNNQQSESVLKIAQVLARFDWVTEAELTGIDANGIDLKASSDDRMESKRIEFPEAVEDERGLRMSLMQLAMDADIPDGITRVAAAQVKTAKASRYLKALCNHFARGATADYEIDKNEVGYGSVIFEFGECTMGANAEILTLRVSAISQMRFERVKGVIDSHLERFANKEELQIDWIDS